MLTPQKMRRRVPVKHHDPYLFILIIQIVICIGLILLGWLAVKGVPEEVGIREFYREQLDCARLELPDGIHLPDFSAEIHAAADRAAELINDLVTPTNAATELTGAGGWMGNGDGKNAPESCVLSPIRMSARVEPPTGGRVTSFYGWRVHPISGGEDFHRGVDIAAPAGDGIYAALPGTVVAVEQSNIYGNYITLDHGNGLQTTYCHCSTIVAPLGAHLRQGELVATVGNTGISTGAHVHFELQKEGGYYNPAWVLDGMEGYGI